MQRESRCTAPMPSGHCAKSPMCDFFLSFFFSFVPAFLSDLTLTLNHCIIFGMQSLLCCQSSLIAGIERFLKQAIVDKQTSVASAALVSSMHLWAQNKEVVKRWVNEVQEAMNNKGQKILSFFLLFLESFFLLEWIYNSLRSHGSIPRLGTDVPDQAKR